MRLAAFVILIPAVLALGACGRQERIISITSEPAGAIVWLNDYELGRTPVEAEFTFFGTFDVRLAKEGYEPLITSREAEAPLHEFPVIDLVATAIPGTRRTRLEWHFQLAPLAESAGRESAEAALRTRATEFKTEAEKHTTGDPEAPAQPAQSQDQPK
jgi:hypothetical protein